MATGSVSATKFRAAAFGGCEAPAGDGRGPRGREGVVGAAGRAEEAAAFTFDGDGKLGHCLLCAFPDRPRGAATIPHSWVEAHGAWQPSLVPFKPRKQAE